MRRTAHVLVALKSLRKSGSPASAFSTSNLISSASFVESAAVAISSACAHGGEEVLLTGSKTGCRVGEEADGKARGESREAGKL